MSAKIEIDVIVNTPAAAAKLQNVQKEIAKTATAANKLDSTIGTSISNGANKAGQSIFNLTEKLRTLQSNVFTEKDRGKIALYNAEIKTTQKEIASLSSIGTSSFGNIGAGATKAFSVLRTAANILPGIGIAGLLAFATGPIIEYASSLFDASDKMKKLKSETEAAAKAKQGFFADAGKEAAGVAGLIAVLENETETRKRKNDALKELQKINPEIFGALVLEKGAVQGLDSAYAAYIESLKTVIAAKIKQQQIEQKVTELLKLQGVTLVGNEKALKTFFDKRAADDEKRLRSLGVAGATAAADGIKSFQQAAVNQIVTIENEIKVLQQDLADLSKGIDVPITKDPEQKAKVKKIVQELRIDFKDEFIQAPLDVSPVLTDKGAKDYIDSVKAGLVLRLQALKIPFNPLDNAEGLQKQLDDAQARLEKFRQDVTDILQNTFQNAAVAVGEGIGKALGGGGISSLFDGLFTAIGNGLESLGTYLIKTYTLIAVIKKIKFSNPVVGIAAGVALVALGALISSKINNTKAFANGGFVSGRGTATSDSIPALLSNGEFVLKAAAVQRLGLGNVERLNSGGAVGDIAAGASVGVPYIVSTEISGQNLRLVLKRADASYGRNT